MTHRSASRCVFATHPTCWRPGNVVCPQCSPDTCSPAPRPTPFAVGRKLGSFPCSIPPSFVLSYNMPMTNNTNNWLCLAWFKNARFRVTLGISARTLIGPALERVYTSPWSPCWGFSSARTAYTPEAPASERAAHPSATRRDSCRLDWGLHCAGTGGGSGRTEAMSSSP